ncbi:unnamed protein product [Cyprideis torosa]|uniref:Uncharacterized protein n=1 Tax=Cyprideis torosa TaxID=163714 RepID=A0A7R8WJ97_9CRUS|nr:unnamed protein product [Cyprideis torosa]CAG0895473.1 unnamed protein product [Cyprideis torosa]
MYNASESLDFDREEIPTYEDVARMFPRPNAPRPIVLVGPPGVGRNELKRRLLALDPEKYKTTVPYTSRPKKPHETQGKEYHFVTREEMEEDVLSGKFVEFGEYKGNLYGTTAASIKDVINSGFVCVLNPHYQVRNSALKMLRTPDIKPFVVLIKPPSFERLKETRQAAFARSTFDDNTSRGFTDEEFYEMIRSAERMEFHYGHLFDTQIVNEDLSTAFEELLATVHMVLTEPLWVPVSWVQ